MPMKPYVSRRRALAVKRRRCAWLPSGRNLVASFIFAEGEEG
jgi:hypothetical protein